MRNKILLSLLIAIFCFLTPVLADDLSVDQIIANLQASQSAVKDMSADTITIITSTMPVRRSLDEGGKGAKDMIQKGKILTKYPDKSRTETFSHTHQVTITNGDKTIIIDKDTGQRIEQKLPAANNGKMNLEKAKEQFDFSVKKEGEKYVVTGIPKANNKFFGKIEFLVNPTRWVTTNVNIYNPQGKVISESTMEYEQISNVWVLDKTISDVLSPMGNMKMEMVYENVKVNQGIKDSEFSK